MGENTKALVHIDAKAAEALVNQTARGVEGLLRPRQIVKMAKAQAKADKIKAKSDIEIAEMEIRARYRLEAVALLEQQNLEAIAARTRLLLADGADSENVDDDWMENLRDKARLVSDEEMQGMWARLLAGEINEPGAFSRRTVNAVADMDRRDCESFTRLCRFCWVIDGCPTPLVYGEEFYESLGLTFGMLVHLESIGLVSRREGSNDFRKPLTAPCEASYFNERFVVELPAGANSFRIGRVVLTSVGIELYSIAIAGVEPVPGFLDFVLKHWTAFKRVDESSQSP